MEKVDQDRIRATWISLLIGGGLLGAKFFAYELTGSKAVFSDAMESIVNVLAAISLIVSIRIATKPADKEHPYGHGKFEFFSAIFEGGLLSFAGVLIMIEGVGAMIRQKELTELDLGVFIVFAAGVVNLLLGLFLKSQGKKTRSPALLASGTHIIADFWTSLAVIVGLALVRLSGWLWVDGLVAIVVSVLLMREGFGILRHSTSGLVDAEDQSVIQELGQIIEKQMFPGMIRMHAMRVIRSGRHHHVDAHIVVPEFWTTSESHEKTERFERQIVKAYPNPAEFHFHVDPCRRAYCRVCELSDCTVRREPFQKRLPFTLEELTSPTELGQFAGRRYDEV